MQVLARHIEPMMSNLRAIIAHRKFKREPLESVGMLPEGPDGGGEPRTWD